jgi:hypothetical protein
VSRPPKKKKEAKSDSSFSVLTRWFTEAKQYLVAFSASIVAFGVLQGQITRIHWTNWVADIVALIPLLLVFVCKTLPRLVKAQREKVLVESSKREIVNPRPAVTEADYFYIGPYPESRRPRYDRADEVHKEVLSWLKATEEPVVVLSGLSGTGKTSLLQVFVIPELRESKPPFTVLTSVDALKDLKNLQTLVLRNCTRLTSVDGLKDLKNLKILDLSGCIQIPADTLEELHKQLALTKIADPSSPLQTP